MYEKFQKELKQNLETASRGKNKVLESGAFSSEKRIQRILLTQVVDMFGRSSDSVGPDKQKIFKKAKSGKRQEES